VALATAGYLLAAALAGVRRGNQEFLIYLGVMLVLAALVWRVHRRVGLRIATLWCLSAWGLLHMAGGLLEFADGEVLYSFWFVPERLKYDQVVHAFGFGVTTWVCWQALRTVLPDPRPRTGPLILCVAAGMGFGALNEVVEFVLVLLLPETNVGGYRNTGWDLVANLTGCVVAAAIIARAGRAPAATARP